MRWIRIFRAIIDFVYFFALLGAVAAPLALLLATEGATTRFNIGGNIVQNVHWSFYAVLIISIIGYFVFVRMLYLMKQAAWKLNPRDLFNGTIADLMTRAGKNCILAAVLTKIPSFLYSMIAPYATGNVHRIEYTYNFGYGFDSLFVILSFGFFMMLSGIIIRQGIVLKQENELTI